MSLTLTDQQILEEIRAELSAMAVPNASEAAPEMSWEDLDIDSLELVELVKALEDRYGIEIPDEELEPIKGIADAIGLVQRLAG